VTLVSELDRLNMVDMALIIIDIEFHKLQALSSFREGTKYIDWIDLLGKNFYKFSLFKCQN
jgi:hypothetical protein